MSEWTSSTLGQVAKVYSGGTPSRSISRYWGGTVPWVTTAEIGVNSIVTTVESITEEGLRNSAARIAPSGTLLMAMYGQGKTRGKTSILGIDAAMNQACAALEPSKDVSPRFLLHYLQAHYEDIRSLSNSGSQENLSGKIVKQIPIQYPPLPEQKQIAKTLDDVSRAASRLEKLIAKKRAVKQGMIQELLSGRTRLTPSSDAWPTVTLGESGQISGGGGDKKIRPGEPQATLLNYMDVYRSEFVNASNLWQVVSVPAAKVSKCSVRAGDVFFTPTSETPDDIARSAVALDGIPGTIYSYHLVRWRPSASWDARYLGFAFQAEEFRAQVSTLAAGSGTRYVISIPGFRGLRIPRPSPEEQKVIGETLSTASAEVSALERRLEAARAIKQGMMQELLTGRARLAPTEATM